MSTYVLSLLAHKYDPLQHAGIIAHAAAACEAADEDAARVVGMKKALRLWPKADSWTFYSVAATRFSPSDPLSYPAVIRVSEEGIEEGRPGVGPGDPPK